MKITLHHAVYKPNQTWEARREISINGKLWGYASRYGNIWKVYKWEKRETALSSYYAGEGQTPRQIRDVVKAFRSKD